MERKANLSKRESDRTELFIKKAEELQADGYREHDLSMSILKANIMALIYPVPPIVILLVLYLWKQPFALDGFARRYLMEHSIGVSFTALIGLLVLIVVHELLHGVTWAAFVPGHFKDIEFGVAKELLTPYCNCKVPMNKWQYLLGGFMPCLILGILPGVLSIFLGSATLFLISAVMIVAAGGDLAVIAGILTRKGSKSDTLYFDHPYQCGVVVFER